MTDKETLEMCVLKFEAGSRSLSWLTNVLKRVQDRYLFLIYIQVNLVKIKIIHKYYSRSRPITCSYYWCKHGTQQNQTSVNFLDQLSPMKIRYFRQGHDFIQGDSFLDITRINLPLLRNKLCLEFRSKNELILFVFLVS